MGDPRQLKVGDKVRIVKNQEDDNWFIKGDIATVMRLDKDAYEADNCGAYLIGPHTPSQYDRGFAPYNNIWEKLEDECGDCSSLCRRKEGKCGFYEGWE